MGLHFPLMVNNKPIGYFEAIRGENLTSPGRDIPGPDDTLLYDYELHQFNHIGNTHKQKVGTVSHRFGDGAWKLVSRILEDADYLLGDDNENTGT